MANSGRDSVVHSGEGLTSLEPPAAEQSQATTVEAGETENLPEAGTPTREETPTQEEVAPVPPPTASARASVTPRKTYPQRNRNPPDWFGRFS